METAFVHEYIPVPVTPEAPRNGEADVVELRDGRLLMVYGEFAGPGDAASATLQGVFSADRGRTWQGKRLVQENFGGRNVMSVSLLRRSDGDILLLFLRKDEEHARCTPFIRRSRDEGETWSDPAPVTEVGPVYYVVNNGRLVELQDGRLLIPADVMKAGETLGDVVFRSDDGGESWTATPPHPFLPESNTGPQEPGVIELTDGRIMMWCRCDLGQIYRCYSEDRAETFGPWGPMGLKAPCSPATIKRLPSTGDLMCIFNNHETPPEYWAQGRSPLTAAVSTDEGGTWRVAGDLEPDRTQSYCYTSVTFIGKGEVLLTYYLGTDSEAVIDGRFRRRHWNLAHLKVGIFEESWLYRAPG